MSFPRRNAIFDALFALAANSKFNGQAFITMSRKFKHFADVDADQQPAMYQTEPLEIVEQRKGMPAKRIWQVAWTIYFRSDSTNDKDIPSYPMNDFIDDLESLFPSDDPDQRQTLDGLVDNCWIDGEIVKVDGTQDGQGLIIVPISIQVP